jgi:adenosylcobinamide amidohydrolase
MKEEAITIHKERDALILSFPQPGLTLSWAVLNGGFCRADHIVNHHVDAGDLDFAADPEGWLQRRVGLLNLEGKIVAMATAVDMAFLVQIAFSDGVREAACFATVGCSNALSAGDRASFQNDKTASPHTINMILLVRPGLREEAMVEAVQIATEGRVRALHEAGVLSRQSGLPATGTGTDCMAVVSLGEDPLRYCGKHTSLGEMVGLAAYTAVKTGVEKGRTGANP